ncbi:hypothetical protein AHAS_Ahas03G0184100 [Arachis hypogaea]
MLPTQLVLWRWCKDAKSSFSVGVDSAADPKKAFSSKDAPRGSMNARMGRRYRRCHGLRHDRRNSTANGEGPDGEGAGTINSLSQSSSKRVI